MPGEAAAEMNAEDEEDDLFVMEKGDKATDEITGCPLLRPHVSWRSPDGSAAMRINISTMRKIASRAREWRQPPHFRTRLDDQMRAQIERKFGESALRAVWSLNPNDGGSSPSGNSQYHNRDTPRDDFFDQFARWREKRLLSWANNLYVCPICLHWLKSPVDETGGLSDESQDSAEEDVRDSEDDESASMAPRASRRGRKRLNVIDDDDEEDTVGQNARATSASGAACEGASMAPRASRRSKRKRSTVIHDEEDEDTVTAATSGAAREGAGASARAALGGECSSCPHTNGRGVAGEKPEGADDSESGEEAAESAECSDVKCPCDPIRVLYDAPRVREWHERTGLPLSAAAAQCCFRSASQLRAHMLEAHQLSESMCRQFKERAAMYLIRGGDGLVHRYQNEVGLDREGDVRHYWQTSPTGEFAIANDWGLTPDDDDIDFASRTLLYCAMYDEVEAQVAGNGYIAVADESGRTSRERRSRRQPRATSESAAVHDAGDVLFSDRLAAASLPARPSGRASDSKARRMSALAWEELGFGDDEDEAEAMRHFVASDGDDEEVEGEDGDVGGWHMARHMQELLEEDDCWWEGGTRADKGTKRRDRRKAALARCGRTPSKRVVDSDVEDAEDAEEVVEMVELEDSGDDKQGKERHEGNESESCHEEGNLIDEGDVGEGREDGEEDEDEEDEGNIEYMEGPDELEELEELARRRRKQRRRASREAEAQRDAIAKASPRRVTRATAPLVARANAERACAEVVLAASTTSINKRRHVIMDDSDDDN